MTPAREVDDAIRDLSDSERLALLSLARLTLIIALFCGGLGQAQDAPWLGCIGAVSAGASGMAAFLAWALWRALRSAEPTL